MSLADFLKVFVIGIVEGVTEWLPISSTGHMILVEQFIKPDVSDEFMEMFRVVIQLGAILAVIILYFEKLWPLTVKKQGYIKKEVVTLWTKVIIAMIPAAVAGILFDDLLDTYLYNPFVVSIMLILYGVFFIIIENKNRGRKFKITETGMLGYKMAFGIGVFQILALIPGTSRSGATILAGMLLGASRSTAAEFSFYLAIPVMAGASLLKILKFGTDFTKGELSVLISGMAVAFIVSVITIKLLMNFIKNRDFKAFGYYRIVLGVLVIIYSAIFN